MVIVEFSPLTGEGLAGFSVPIGKSTEVAVYPHLITGPQETSASIRLAFGKRSSLSLDELWQPRNVLWQGEVALPVAWPEAWMTVTETPEEYDGIVLVELILAEPASAERLFTIECIGTGQVSSPVTEFLVAQGKWGVGFELKAARPGLYRLHAMEVGGSVDIYSQIAEVLGNDLLLKDAHAPGAPQFNGNYYAAVEDQPWDPEDQLQECRPATAGSPTKPTKFVGCTECFEPAYEDPPEPECGSAVKGLIHPAKCVDSDEWYCELYEDPNDPTMNCPRYDYAGIQQFSCGSTTTRLQLSGQPFGVGLAGSTAWTTAKVKLCCKYDHKPGETVPVKRKKCRNFY